MMSLALTSRVTPAVVLVKRKMMCMEQLALIRDELTSSAFSLPFHFPLYAFLFKKESNFQKIYFNNNRWSIRFPAIRTERTLQRNASIIVRLETIILKWKSAFRWFSIIINSRVNCNPGPTDDVPRWLIIDFDGLLVRLHAPPPENLKFCRIVGNKRAKRKIKELLAIDPFHCAFNPTLFDTLFRILKSFCLYLSRHLFH